MTISRTHLRGFASMDAAKALEAQSKGGASDKRDPSTRNFANSDAAKAASRKGVEARARNRLQRSSLPVE